MPRVKGGEGPTIGWPTVDSVGGQGSGRQPGVD